VSSRLALRWVVMSLVLAGIFPARLGTAGEKHRALGSAMRIPVLVELFTSEGCSDCPPADALLEKLDRTESINNVEVVALSEHVDYWNDIGWADPYSSHEYSARQGSYGRQFGLGSVYTPQMVVDGRAQFVGSSERDALRAIADASRTEKIPVNLSSVRFENAKRIVLHLDVGPSPKLATAKSADVLVAVADDSDVSSVTRGENAGRTLRHVAVVRSLVLVGNLNSGGRFSQDVMLDLDRGSARTVRLVAFIQEPRTGGVLGAGLARISN
jgi:hypothetical protein